MSGLGSVWSGEPHSATSTAVNGCLLLFTSGRIRLVFCLMVDCYTLLVSTVDSLICISKGDGSFDPGPRLILQVHRLALLLTLVAVCSIP